ncbi:MAG: hypothetical protein NZ954_03760 [Thermofilaceae archaeon]|nr:hypothetical protein [Thermofilaceae archaeon]MCX8181312.1 hypothetical protein [Thermofilaceae archaeon]
MSVESEADETVVLFVYKGEQCARLVKDVYDVLQGSGRRARLKVITASIQNPNEFTSFLEYLGELYGKQYVAEYEKHNIRRLPALVAGGTKLFEGVFPSKEQLAQLFGTVKPITLTTGQPPPTSSGSLKSEMPSAGGGCRGCIFFESSSNRCVLLRAKVESPSKPPCGRR